MNSETVPSRSIYLVRSARCIPLETGLVGVGWSATPFKDSATAEELLEKMRADGWELDRQPNQIRRFKAIRRGDLVVVPWWGAIAIGEALGEERYDASEPCFSQNGSNQHRVRFPVDSGGKVKLLARTELNEALQRRLKIRITIADLSEFADEIEEAYNNLVAGRAHSLAARIEVEEARLVQAAKEILLANIQQGRTGLAAGGVGLECLVRELLEIDGFDAVPLSKRHFGAHTADADISATRSSFLGSQQYFIQVKHHWGDSGEWGVQQLIDIPDKFPSEYGDHELVLVTSGELSREARALAEQHDVIVVNGAKLVDWVFASTPHLRRETQLALGLMNVPALFNS